MTAGDKKLRASYPRRSKPFSVAGNGNGNDIGTAVWPGFLSPKRAELSNFTRAYRVAERLHAQHGVPVAILQQQCSVQSHCVVWGEKIFALQQEGCDPVPYKVVTVLF